MKLRSLLLPLLGGILSTAGASAHAVVSAPAIDTGDGDFANISYGALADGNVSGLSALLRPAGDGLLTQQIKQRTDTVPDLKFDLAGVGPTGAGTGLEQFVYKVTNVGAVAHNDLRFMVTLLADGNPSSFQEKVAETWGALQPGDPTRRETVNWGATGNDPGAALNNAWTVSGGAASPDGAGVPASCATTTGCDSSVGLQWDIASLKPGQSFIVRVGLSDDGQHLSSRYFTLTADPTGGINNALTFSGTVQIVPEPSSIALLLGGLGLVGVILRRRLSAEL